MPLGDIFWHIVRKHGENCEGTPSRCNEKQVYQLIRIEIERMKIDWACCSIIPEVLNLPTTGIVGMLYVACCIGTNGDLGF